MEQLRIPGPTPCPPEVLKALGRQMVNHRGEEFKQMLVDVTAKLKQFFQTKNDVLLLTGSGTGGLEAAIVNTLSPGESVLTTAASRPPVPDPVSISKSFLVWNACLSLPVTSASNCLNSSPR